MKVYPRYNPRCSAVGRFEGAVDPKMLRKWVWLSIKHITKLADNMVSNLTHC
jgi:hypothetical protein